MLNGDRAIQHQPVLLEAVLQALPLAVEDGIFIDCTFGRGGHSSAMLKQMADSGRLIAIDRDPEAVQAGQMLAANDQRFSIEQGAFSSLKTVAEKYAVCGKVNGILFDFGVSSPQLDNAERGFSFLREGPLDMRMDPNTSPSAAEWIAKASERELVQVFSEFGEERFSKRIAKAIVASRVETPFERTKQLADLIREVTPRQGKPGEKQIHPATRVFQAIRIYINNELGEIHRVLDQVLEVLAPRGRLAVISFHSLEDRIVKRFIKRACDGDNFPQGLPIPASMIKAEMKLISKRIRADKNELSENPRARSAVMRVAERVA